MKCLRRLYQSKGVSAVRILKCFQLCGAFISVWTGESEGLFSCIAFLGRRLRLSRWESSRRSRVRGGYAHFLYCHLSDVLRAPPPSSRRSLQEPFARLQISPLLGEACKGASHRLHIPPKGETEKERAKPITKFSACISFQEGKIKKGGKPPFL